MEKGMWSAAGLGAGLMYLLDPDRGRPRRALVRDQMVSGLEGSGDALGKVGRDAKNRLHGLFAEAKSRVVDGDFPSDAVLEERVRATIGRHVSHPGAIEVRADLGRITLTGPVLADEVDELLQSVREVRGVADVENRLEAHLEPGDVPGLQGEVRPRGEPGILDERSPALRFAAGAAGGALALVVLRRLPGGKFLIRGLVGLGIGMLARKIGKRGF